MAGNAKIYKPKATVDLRIPGVDSASVSGVTILLRIGGWSSANISFHPMDAAGKATKVFSSDVSRVLGKIQQQGFTDRLEADATIRLVDGQGDGLSFSGLTTSPSFSLSPGQLSRSIELVHTAALIDGIKSGIYGWRGYLWSEHYTTISAKSWSLFFKDVFEFLVKNGRENWSKLIAADSEITVQSHTLNTKLIPILNQILTDSESTTKSSALEKMVDNTSTAIANSIGQTMLSYLTSCREGFWGTLSQFCTAFQLLYVPPGTEGGYGRLIRLQEALTAPPIPRNLMLLSCRYQSTTGAVLPLQQVLLRVSGEAMWGWGIKTNEPRALACWPKSTSKTTGQVLDTSVPGWIIPKTSLDPAKAQPRRVALKAPGISESVTIENFTASNTINQRITQSTDELINEFLEEYAHSLYVDRSLASSSFTIAIPLDVGWKPGKRYLVQDEGSPLFTGFLAQVQHQAAVGPGQGSASSTLTFTHVELGDFKLAGA